MTGDNGVIKRMQIGGIVRSTSAMNNADGTCEEIINLRQDEGVWRVIGEKNVKVQDIQYEQVLLHEYSDFENYLGVKKWSETEKDETGMTVVKTRRAVVWFDPDTKEEKQEICRVEGEATLEQINNILLVKDSSNIVKAVFNTGKYEATVLKLPDCPYLQIHKAISKHVISNTKDIDFELQFSNQYNQESFAQGNELLKGLYNQMISKYKGYTEGYVFLTVAYELFDGSITKPSNPYIYYLGETGELVEPSFFTGSLSTGTNKRTLKDVYFSMYVGKISVQPTFYEFEKYKEIIKGIVVYATKPFSYFDFENLQCQYIKSNNGSGDSAISFLGEQDEVEGLPLKKLKVDDLQVMLFYEVAKFSLTNTDFERKEVDFSKITTNPTMPVDASGWLNTSGDMFVYNNRLHLYNVRQKFNSSILFPGLYFGIKNEYKKVNVVISTYLKSGLSSMVINASAEIYFDITEDGPNFFRSFLSFPDSRAYKAVISYSDKENNKIYSATLRLTPSKVYNYSHYICVENEGKIAAKETTEIPSDSDLLTDSSKIIVSGQSNPYFFPPECSYTVDGEILNLAVNTQQISASQIGQFPLYAFTTEGIYALQQGEGKVLYSNVIPVSAEVAVKGSSVLQTKYGIVFVTADGLKLISGSEVVDLSEAVKGRIDEYFMKQRSYNMILEDSWLWNASPFISRIPFEEYIQEAVMGYDIVKDEIIVSNPAYRYSYVYSLKTKTWHKITEVFSSFSRHLALKQNWPSGHDVCDIREEVKGIRPVLMLTRPVNLGNFGYNMVYHYCMRGEIRPLKEEERCNSLSVFLSNDLQYWEFGPQANPIIDMPVVPLDRLLCASRYFRLLYTGEVEPEHTLALVEMDGEEKFDNKIR